MNLVFFEPSLLLALGASQQSGGNVLMQFVPFALILAIFYFIILLPMKKRQKKVQEFQNGLKVGDKIVTTSGIYGLISKVDERSIRLQIADKVRIEISRSAVGGYQGQDPVVPESGNS
jgi:preprotein translocase subunit YajC